MTILAVPGPRVVEVTDEIATLADSCESLLSAVADPLERAKSAERMAHLLAQMTDMARKVRINAVVELSRQHRQHVVATQLGVSPTRVSQLVSRASRRGSIGGVR